jgi:hypothetical protein
LLSFDFRMEFKPGASNVVDVLSRHDMEDAGTTLALSAPMFQLLDDIRSSLAHDPALCGLCEDVQAGRCGSTWQFTDGLITMADRVYLPPSSPSVQAVLTMAHSAGHEGVEKTLHRLRHDFFLPGAHGIVRDLVRTCTVCQRNKVEQLHPGGLLPRQIASDAGRSIGGMGGHSHGFRGGIPKD